MKKETDYAAQNVHRTGGLYAKINMSLKSADIMVAALTALLIAALIFVIGHNGFTVKFDTDGGSHIEPVRAMHSEKIEVENPVKEGFVFTGWYTDRACTQKWNPKSDTVTESMTLYAGWESIG